MTIVADVAMTQREVLKVTAASMFGTIVDFYDFFVAGTAAAVVWPAVFFPASNPAAALLLSIGTYGSGYVSRPVGSLIFGHFGDKIGRKTTLVWTLITMGVGVSGIALTPGYASIGVMGGVLVLVFRLLQGIGAGGEYGGAEGLVAEYAKDSKHRAFWISWVQQGFSIGIIIASSVWAFLIDTMPHNIFFDWGWRIPFVLGLIVLIVGAGIRYSLQESPLFIEFVEKKALERRPSLSLWKHHWKRVLLLSIIPLPYVGGSAFISTFTTPFSAGLKIPVAFTTATVTYGGIVGIIVAIIFALLADKIGRKRSIYIAAIVPTAFAFPYMFLLAQGTLLWTLVANVVYLAGSRLSAGVFPAVLAESYPVKYRYSGSSMSYAIASIVGGTVLPLIATYVNLAMGGPANSWIAIGFIMVVYMALAAIAMAFIQETKGKDIAY
jgi:MFS family permease